MSKYVNYCQIVNSSTVKHIGLGILAIVFLYDEFYKYAENYNIILP